MVPDVAAKGHSFKGAFAYYLHDKQQVADGPKLSTSERVAWTETRNLMTDDPATAQRIMVATARQADALKAAAGIKATGRKSNAHVYAYSLAWHPDEAGSLDKAEMIRAADASLKALGADHLQAVFVCHQDQKHPHVHIILNRVDPATGKMHGFSNDRRQLSDWANAYERERGKILTPKREENRVRISQQFSKSAATGGTAVLEWPQRKPSEAALLKTLSDAQKERHKKEWIDLGAGNKAAREQVYAEFGAAITAAATEHKAKTRPAWSAFFRAARQSEQAFFKREQSIIGILENAIAATRLGERGSLRALFGNVLSSGSRVAAFRAAQDAARGDVSRQVKAQLDSHIAALKEQRQATLAAQRLAYTNTRAALIERQDGEKAKMREAWKQVYERRGKDPAYLARQKAARSMEQKPMDDKFKKAAELPIAKQPAVPVVTYSLSTPAPALTPAGMPAPPARTAQDVPKVDKAAAWSKTPQGRYALAKDTPAPQAGQNFQKSAGVSPTAPPVRKDWGATQTASDTPHVRKDWGATADKPREIKPLPTRDRDKDFER